MKMLSTIVVVAMAMLSAGCSDPDSASNPSESSAPSLEKHAYPPAFLSVVFAVNESLVDQLSGVEYSVAGTLDVEYVRSKGTFSFITVPSLSVTALNQKSSSVHSFGDTIFKTHSNGVYNVRNYFPINESTSLRVEYEVGGYAIVLRSVAFVYEEEGS